MASPALLLLATADVIQPGSPVSGPTGPTSGGLMSDAGIIVMLGAGLALMLFVWAKYLRRSRHRGHEPSFDPPLRTGPRRKRVRSSHRPRNPTLAETGGLPPIRNPDAPQPPGHP